MIDERMSEFPALLMVLVERDGGGPVTRKVALIASLWFLNMC